MNEPSEITPPELSNSSAVDFHHASTCLHRLGLDTKRSSANTAKMKRAVRIKSVLWNVQHHYTQEYIYY
jgi:hypothetical protein